MQRTLEWTEVVSLNTFDGKKKLELKIAVEIKQQTLLA